jgi:hypothetical protein
VTALKADASNIVVIMADYLSTHRHVESNYR